MTYTINQIVDAMMLIQDASYQFTRGNYGPGVADPLSNVARAMGPVVEAAYMRRCYGEDAAPYSQVFYNLRDIEPGYSMVNQ